METIQAKTCLSITFLCYIIYLVYALIIKLSRKFTEEPVDELHFEILACIRNNFCSFAITDASFVSSSTSFDYFGFVMFVTGLR